MPMFIRRLIVDGRVVGVQRREHEVARQRRLDRDLGRLEVADLADEDDVGVLPQEGAQRRREGQADLLLHLDLVDAGEVELDRVLGRHDVDGRVVQGGDRGVERVRLARAGRPGDEHDAVGPVDRVLEAAQRLLVEAELRHVELQLRLVEQPHDDLLAELRRDARDAQVEVARALLDAQPDLDAAVLRQALLGDVELRHDLQARDQGIAGPHRQRHDVVQDAVDAEADAELLLVRLDVDVRGARLQGLDEDQVGDLDDRRGFARLREVREVDLLALLAASRRRRRRRRRGR